MSTGYVFTTLADWLHVPPIFEWKTNDNVLEDTSVNIDPFIVKKIDRNALPKDSATLQRLLLRVLRAQDREYEIWVKEATAGVAGALTNK